LVQQVEEQFSLKRRTVSTPTHGQQIVLYYEVKMKVYRVEHKVSGQGPYTYYDEKYKWGFDIDIRNKEKHPDPYSDNLSRFTYDELFGFKCMKTMKKWFNKKSRKYLHQHSFILQVFEVDKEYVRIGDHQITFYPEYAQRVDQIDLLSI